MIELVWVDDAEEAQSECSRRTQLWERWSSRAGKASPFGICVRPVNPQNRESPFPAWKYRPSYFPDPLVMHVEIAHLGTDIDKLVCKGTP
jgi:hypothetical protein